ncbi:MAG: hypothetical protein R3A79_27185 [Nannocystaceae bacterium]
MSSLDETERSPARERSSVLAALEEDYEEPHVEVPQALSVDSARALIDRLHKAAQFGDDSLEELPRLLQRIEGVRDPGLLPELLGLFEDSDPYGIYWNILYVLENFPDEQYLSALLEALPALYARAPVWAETCVIRVLNTRGDPDDCTATFERLVKAGTDPNRLLVLELLGEMLHDPESDLDKQQLQTIEEMILSLGGKLHEEEPPAEPVQAAPAPVAPVQAAPAPAQAPAPVQAAPVQAAPVQAAPVQAKPAPTPVEPAPAPTPVQAAPAPTPVEPAPAPAAPVIAAPAPVAPAPEAPSEPAAPAEAAPVPETPEQVTSAPAAEVSPATEGDDGEQP